MRVKAFLLGLLCWIPCVLAQEPAWKLLPAPEWDQTFRRSFGWNGADGAYSVPLQGGWSGWLFSDTFVGPVLNDGSRPADSTFLHNSWARVQEDRPALAVFSSRPLVKARPGHWFWVYQPWLDSNFQGSLFLGEFTTGDGPEGLNFRQVGTSLVSLDWRQLHPIVGAPRSLPHYRQHPAPLNFGAALLQAGDFHYVYATRDLGQRKEVVVARVPLGRLEVFEEWKFFSTSGWVPQVDLASVILPDASNEFSVYTRGQEFRLLTQVGSEIRLYRSSRPEGPFSQSVILVRVPVSPDQAWTYNAKAHPRGREPMLITYNRNSFPPQKVLDEADLYRPRCFHLYGDPWLP